MKTKLILITLVRNGGRVRRNRAECGACGRARAPAAASTPDATTTLTTAPPAPAAAAPITTSTGSGGGHQSAGANGAPAAYPAPARLQRPRDHHSPATGGDARARDDAAGG